MPARNLDTYYGTMDQLSDECQPCLGDTCDSEIFNGHICKDTKPAEMSKTLSGPLEQLTIECKPRSYECCTCEYPGTAMRPLYNCHGCPHIGHIGCLGDSIPLWTCEHCEDIPTSTDSEDDHEQAQDNPRRLKECERCCLPTSNYRCIYCNDLTCDQCRSQGFNVCCADQSETASPSEKEGHFMPCPCCDAQYR